MVWPASGTNSIRLVTVQGSPSNPCAPPWHVPKLLIVPEPVMMTRLVSTLSSPGEIFTVAAHGSDTAGLSPSAQVNGVNPMHQQALQIGAGPGGMGGNGSCTA